MGTCAQPVENGDALGVLRVQHSPVSTGLFNTCVYSSALDCAPIGKQRSDECSPIPVTLSRIDHAPINRSARHCPRRVARTCPTSHCRVLPKARRTTAATGTVDHRAPKWQQHLHADQSSNGVVVAERFGHNNATAHARQLEEKAAQFNVKQFGKILSNWTLRIGITLTVFAFFGSHL